VGNRQPALHTRALLLGSVALLVACTGDWSGADVPQPAAPALPAPEPIELTAAFDVDGGTITVLGTTNLPNGAVLLWEVYDSPPPEELFDLSIFDDPDVSREGTVTVEQGTFQFTATGEGWSDLDLCGSVPMVLRVIYAPWRGILVWGRTDAEQPDAVHELHGELGERIAEAVPPAKVGNGLGDPPRIYVELADVRCR